eukprot:1158437-Amphidinium_carterae.1
MVMKILGESSGYVHKWRWRLHVSDAGGCRVQRYAGGTGTTTVVAGGAEPGYGPDELNDAQALHVSCDGVLYIADFHHRIQKWYPGASEGSTVAGGNCRGCLLDQLYGPRGLLVTKEGYIYVADTENGRVVKWKEGWTAGLLVAGGQAFSEEEGSELHQLRGP